MRFITAVTAAASALGASASIIEPRDTSACLSAATKYLPAIQSDVPTANGAVVSYLITASITDQCAFPTVTGTLGSSISSYASSYSSWRSEHLSELRSVYLACSDVPEVTSQLGSYFADATGSACSSILAEITGTTSSTGSKNAAPRETGLPIAAAAMVAGVAAAML